MDFFDRFSQSLSHHDASTDLYNNKKEIYTNNLFQNNYIFETTKCCGYDEWVTVYKDDKVTTLYKNIEKAFQYLSCFKEQDKIQIIARALDGELLVIPKVWIENNDEEIGEYQQKEPTIREFLNNPTNHKFFKPVYPIPAKVVYKIWLDDGICHHDHSKINTPCGIHP